MNRWWLWLTFGLLMGIELSLGGWIRIAGLPLPWVWLAIYLGCLYLPRWQWLWLGLAVGVVLELAGWQVLGSGVLFMAVWLALMSRLMGSLDRAWREWWWLGIWFLVALGQALHLVFEAVLMDFGWQHVGQLGLFIGWQVVLLALMSVIPSWLVRHEAQGVVNKRLWE